MGAGKAVFWRDTPTLWLVHPLTEPLSDDPAWPLIQTWISGATSEVVVHHRCLRLLGSGYEERRRVAA